MKQETTNKTNYFTLSGAASGIRGPSFFAWRMGWWVFVVLAVLVMTTFVSASASTAPAFAPNCTIFPADNVWHADVSELPVQSRSDDWISSMGGPRQFLHPDFGPSGEDMPYGIPFDVIDGDHPKVEVNFDGPDGGYPEESDSGPYPFDADTKIEGGTNSTGDRHALMVDRDNCVLYELYHAYHNDGNPIADQGSVFDLRSNDLRPDGWTSADAAGLPIFAGLVRRDEVVAGEVDHAIRVTAQRTDRSYLWPARHQAGARSDPTLPPMGARFRLKADFDISGFRPDTQVVLRAMKKHGLIVADNGSNWFFGGTAEEGWDNDMLDELKTIPAGRLEAVDASSLMVAPDSGRVADTTSPSSPPDCTIPGTNGNDTLTGTSSNDVICGLGGDDIIDGEGGNDTIRGGEGSDTLVGGTGKDKLYGQGGDDTLDVRDGVRLNDVADGGTGIDTCTGDRKRNKKDKLINCP